MQAGSLVGGDVSGYFSAVLVGGVKRDHQSWSVDRALTGDMPSQVVAISGTSQATGTVVFSGGDVEVGGRNPWNASSGWLPSAGESVEIWVGDAGTSWLQFTGVIDKVSGSVRGGFEASIIDAHDQLSETVNHEAMLRVMPPEVRGGDFRPAGLSALYYVDYALRAAGFYCTPKLEVRPALSVPMQSSMWPEVGGMASGIADGGDGGPWASTYDAPWGAAMGNVTNTYNPALALSLTTRLQVTLMVAPGHSGNTSISTYYGATDNVSLAVAGSRTVIARLNGAEVCRLVMGSATIVSLVVSEGAWTLKTDAGTTSSGSAANPTSAGMDRIIVNVDTASRVAGLQVSHPNSAAKFASLSHTPTALYDLSNTAHMGIMDAAPALEAQPAEDVINSVGDAVLAGSWIDEAGRFRWAPVLSLTSAPVAKILTTKDDILDLAWESSLIAARSAVELEYRLPGITLSHYDNVLLWDSGGESFESLQRQTDFIEPGVDEDWIGGPSALYKLGSTGSSNPSNTGWGSVYGGVVTDGTTDNMTTSTISATLERITRRTWKLTRSIGNLPSGKTLESRYPSASSSIWGRWLKKDLPLIRGFAKTSWVTVSKKVVVPNRPAAPSLKHDVGPWNSREFSTLVVDRVADYLATQLAAPPPVIPGLEIVYDPRLQLGDVVNISSPRLLGVIFKALVVGVSNSADKVFAQSLSVRIISYGLTQTTYAEFNDALVGANLTYAQWDALGPKPQTYQQFNTAE